jgi:hypothetical protein
MKENAYLIGVNLMNVTICQNKIAPIRVRLNVGDIEFSVVRAEELRDKLTVALNQYKKQIEKEAKNG